MKKFIIKLMIKYLTSHYYVVLDINKYNKLCLDASLHPKTNLPIDSYKIEFINTTYPFTPEQSLKKDENTTN